MVAPLLVFGWGNPSRGDDALGPALVEAVEAMNLPGVECLTDFQLQMDNCLDLKGRERVLFVDASRIAEAPFSVESIVARKDASFSSHAMTAQSVLQVFQDIEGCPPPPSQLLGIRGEIWGLGDPMSASAQDNLVAALDWVRRWSSEQAGEAGPA